MTFCLLALISASPPWSSLRPRRPKRGCCSSLLHSRCAGPHKQLSALARREYGVLCTCMHAPHSFTLTWEAFCQVAPRPLRGPRTSNFDKILAWGCVRSPNRSEPSKFCVASANTALREARQNTQVWPYLAGGRRREFWRVRGPPRILPAYRVGNQRVLAARSPA